MSAPKKANKPQASAARNKSPQAGKRSGQGAKAAQTTPPKAPAGQKSKSTNVVKQGEKKGGLFKFRRYKKVEGGKGKKARHPKLIVEQEANTVGFMGLTESDKRGHHKNIELDKNPEQGNTNKAYLRKEVRYADLGEFGEILQNYNLSESDKAKVIKYLEKLKNKK